MGTSIQGKGACERGQTHLAGDPYLQPYGLFGLSTIEELFMIITRYFRKCGTYRLFWLLFGQN